MGVATRALPRLVRAAAFAVMALATAGHAGASEEEKPVSRHYAAAPPAPAYQEEADVTAKSAGCLSCHTATDSTTMHPNNPAVKLGCTDCHGGSAKAAIGSGISRGTPAYKLAFEQAHILPRYPKAWHYPSSANPERTYTLLNKESREFVRFINPSDFRVVKDTCGACHQQIIQSSVRSLHATAAMFWEAAAYNNGILNIKKSILGESYDDYGHATILKGPTLPPELAAAADKAAILPQISPLPNWESLKPGDIFRVFERGGRNISNLFPETGLPDSNGDLQRIEEPGRPDFRQSNRGPGTGARIAVPVINITKTRLNDPTMWFMGTNDQPGDYRHSGCASCHVVYANDRDPKHSSVYAPFGNEGRTQTVDPTISKIESGHPLTHQLTRAVPTSQCMVCHMHQPNMFMNSMLGYTMWDYESDAPAMWPEKQKYPSSAEAHEILERNPEGAAIRGKWGDPQFLKHVSEMNPTLKDTQFADYHGHGWNFRAVFKRDRKGNLLDKDGRLIADSDTDKFRKAVHMASSHVDAGMQCVDCHFDNDNHGNGYIYGEVASAVEISCKDCHGTVSQYPNLYTSGPAALAGGLDLLNLLTPDGRRRFEWLGGDLYQRSMTDPNREWKVSLVKDSVNPASPAYNEKAARAKLVKIDTKTFKLANAMEMGDPAALAHSDDKIECYTCHTSWTTSCGGCHLPIEANQKTARHHYEGGETRNYATYNPQIARDDMFLLGRREPGVGGRIAPVRSTSALVLSSTNSNREHIYVQQAPIAGSGFSSQAFNPHYPHTERRTETKTCSDCHLSQAGDNNAIMAQLLAQGTNFVNFLGYNAYVGGAGEINAVTVTEWDEPQAVIGSYLQKYAYPDWYKAHEQRGRKLQNAYAHAAGEAKCLQLRGEYLFVAEGKRGLKVYDAASIGNKGVSQRLITAPFSPVGQSTNISTADASCVALPTTQPINPARNVGEKMRTDNMEQVMHPLYKYAYITDTKEGLILTDLATLADGDPRNNYLRRALTWNPGNVLAGASHITIGGNYLYISTPRDIVVVSVDDPLHPQVVSQIALNAPRATFLQFRYLFAVDAEGLKAIDVTDPTQPRLTPNNVILLGDTHRVFVARTYAYVAAGRDGVVIVDVEKPEKMVEYQRFNGGGRLKDVRDIVVASTNASLFGYAADALTGLNVMQLTSPSSQPKFYGFSPEPKPELIASYMTSKPALSLSHPLERDRGVDESGNQIAVFGRRGSRPLNLSEMKHMYLDADGKPWAVSDENQLKSGKDDIATRTIMSVPVPAPAAALTPVPVGGNAVEWSAQK